MKHTIIAMDAGSPKARIVWDDETGTVEGDHSKALELAAAIGDGPMTVYGERPPWSIELADPAHDPSEFLTALYSTVWWPGHIKLPASLAEVTPTRFPSPPSTPPGVIVIY